MMHNARVEDFLRRTGPEYHMQIMKKTHETQLEVKNCLIKNLEDIIDEQEARIFNLESYNSGVQPLSPRHKQTLKGVTALTNQINTLLSHNVDLMEQNHKLIHSEDNKTPCSCNKQLQDVEQLEKRLQTLSSDNRGLQQQLQLIKQQLQQISDENKLLENRCQGLQKCDDEHQKTPLNHDPIEHQSKANHDQCVIKIQKLNAQLTDSNNELETKTKKITQLEDSKKLITKQLKAWWNELRQMKMVQLELVDQVSSNQTTTVATFAQLKQQLFRLFTDGMTGIVTRYKKEIALRKLYYNKLIQLKGNIRVLCRVRPGLIDGECDKTVTFDEADDTKVEVVNSLGRPNTFIMDKVFNPQQSQTAIFDEVRPIVTSCVDGYNVCIFAYGQTGSGKTYTMDGTNENPGVNQRALIELFDETNARRPEWIFDISVSMIEIYNEKLRDLLSGNDISLEVRMTEEGTLHVPGVTLVPVESMNQVVDLLCSGRKSRATATTNMNEHSSRSHALLVVNVNGRNKITQVTSCGRLNLVDLAGSERVGRSAAAGSQLKEAQAINKSLSCLGDVINALKNNKSHVPYRNSKLTYLLKDSLGGDSKTVMVVQVAPGNIHAGETICSLDFAQRVRGVELGPATPRTGNRNSPGSNESQTSNSSEDERLGCFNRSSSARWSSSRRKTSNK